HRAPRHWGRIPHRLAAWHFDTLPFGNLVMFCDHCGTELPARGAPCPACGRRAAGFRALPPAAALENLRGQWVAYARVRMYGGLLLSLQIWGWLEAALSSARGFNPPGGGAASASHSVVPLHVTVAVVFFCGILGIVWGIVGSVGARGLAQGTPVGGELDGSTLCRRPSRRNAPCAVRTDWLAREDSNLHRPH